MQACVDGLHRTNIDISAHFDNTHTVVFLQLPGILMWQTFWCGLPAICDLILIDHRTHGSGALKCKSCPLFAKFNTMRHAAVLSFFLLISLVAHGQEERAGLSPGTRAVIKKMIKYNRIDSEAVGYGAERTAQYDRFIKLTGRATTEELILLTNHKNPVIRGYAFWALARQNYADLYKIFSDHQHDSESVDVLMNCTGGEMPLIGFMTWVVTPNMLDMECKKLY
jgi:hypothetical protein